MADAPPAAPAEGGAEGAPVTLALASSLQASFDKPVTRPTETTTYRDDDAPPPGTGAAAELAKGKAKAGGDRDDGGATADPWGDALDPSDEELLRHKLEPGGPARDDCSARVHRVCAECAVM